MIGRESANFGHGLAACSRSASLDLSEAGKVTGLMTRQKEFGLRLVTAREARGLSRGELAARVGVHVGHYGHVERGEKLVSLMNLARIHGELGCDGQGLIEALDVTVQPVERGKRRRKVAAVRAEPKTGSAEFGRLLTVARSNVGLTQTQVAKAAGCSRRALARFEAGAVLPSLQRFAQLWRVLGFDVDALLAVLRDDGSPREPFYGFGAVVTAARMGLAMSQEQVAQAARCVSGDYLAIERGAMLPTMTAAVRIHAVVRYDANAALRWVWESGAIEKMS